MKPTSHKELIEKTARNLNLSVDFVEKFISFLYDDFQERLSYGEEPVLHLKGLGMFEPRYNQLRTYINKKKIFLNNFRCNDRKLGRARDYSAMDVSIARLTTLRKKMHEEMMRKYEFRKEYYESIGQSIKEVPKDLD